MAKDNDGSLYDKAYFQRRIRATEARIEALRQELKNATVGNFEEVASRLRAAEVKLEAQSCMMKGAKCSASHPTYTINHTSSNHYAN